jgi:aminopeptidase N
MRPRASLIILLLLMTGLAAGQRLPDTAVPDNYELTFTPDFTKDNFAAEETIHIRLLKPTSQIVLNAAHIDFHQVSISSAGMTQKAQVAPDKDKEMVTLILDKSLKPGPATIQIGFTGILNDELRGFYLGKEENGKKYAVTQFEATDARRAFPSFDEPAYKATFDITVVADKGLTAISNNKVLSDTPGPGAGKHTVRFATTAKMSSYLVAIAVGDFEYLEGQADGIPIRIYSTPGKKQLGSFALATAEQCIRYFNHYFGVKYPFEKLDLIGLPDFSAGAMENTGLITFREVILLLDDQQASVDLHKEVADVVSHEIAHMWFGDLVTMQWWDDVWLNEGFATWMSSKPIEAWKPEWNIQLDDVRDSGAALNVDALQNTRPIHQAAETPAQIQELFDGIAYGKAAAVLRMLETYLGPEAFRQGVNAYIHQHAYGNATAGDFWNALASVSNKPVDRVMATFVEQPGAPMVSVTAACDGGATRVKLSQQRYFYDRTLFDAQSKELWQVPVCMKAIAGKVVQEKCELLTRKEDTMTLPGCASWVLANAGATGYYRSGYEPAAVRAMSEDLETALTPGERISLLSDSWASVRVGRQQIGDYLALAQGLQTDRNSAVWGQLAGQLDYIGDYLVNDADRQEYQQWARRLLGPVAKELGWQPAPGESDEWKTLRATVMKTLGYAGRDPEVLAEARRVADRALDNPTAVDRTMAITAFSLAALNGDAGLYDRILDHLKNPKSPEEYYIYVGTLTQFTDPRLLERTLQYALSPKVRTQDTLGLIAGVMENPAGEKLAWDFTQKHWSDIEKIGGGFTSGEVVAATASFCDPGMRDQVRDFFSSHQVPTAERTLKQSLESMNYCVDLKSQQGSQLASWLQQHASSAGE